MKKFIHKIQDLSQKAAHLKQVVESAPAQAAKLRETVLMTAGQLQQIRQDVQASVTGLRADNDDRLAQALREINDSAATFLEAGYALAGVDMDLSPVQRLIVHLEKLESVSESALRSLLSANSGRQTVYALLSALAKADAVSEKMVASHLTYRELVVHVGPTPSVRLCWRSDAVHEESREHVAAAGPPPIPLAPVPATPPTPASTFVQSSYFEQRSSGAPRSAAAHSTAAPESAPLPEHVAASPAGHSEHPAAPPPGGDWRRSALDRFKKMPDASKYRR